jgi:serine/threonine-protein kinase RsbW
MGVLSEADVAVDDLHCRVPAVAERLVQLRRALADWVGRLGVTAQIVEDVVLATYEAMANVVEHAYRGCVSGLLDLRAHADRMRDVITVTDYGRWRPPPADRGARGRGLPLIHSLAQRAEISPGRRGTTVTMTYRMA